MLSSRIAKGEPIPYFNEDLLCNPGQVTIALPQFLLQKKGAGGIIFLTFILSVYSVKEAAANLGPGCRKQEREKSRLEAQGSPAKL